MSDETRIVKLSSAGDGEPDPETGLPFLRA